MESTQLGMYKQCSFPVFYSLHFSLKNFKFVSPSRKGQEVSLATANTRQAQPSLDL